MERRQNSRQPISLPVTLKLLDTSAVPATVLDISLSGLFVESPLCLPSFTRLDVLFDITSAEKRYDFRLESIVVRGTRTGMGLTFERTNPNTIGSLSEALAYLSFCAMERGISPSAKFQEGAHNTVTQRVQHYWPRHAA
jgi:hypothetical protein